MPNTVSKMLSYRIGAMLIHTGEQQYVTLSDWRRVKLYSIGSYIRLVLLVKAL